MLRRSAVVLVIPWRPPDDITGAWHKLHHQRRRTENSSFLWPAHACSHALTQGRAERRGNRASLPGKENLCRAIQECLIASSSVHHTHPFTHEHRMRDALPAGEKAEYSSGLQAPALIIFLPSSLPTQVGPACERGELDSHHPLRSKAISASSVYLGLR